MTFKEAFFSYGRVALDSILNDIKKKSKNKKLIAYLPRYICSDVYQKFSEKNIDIIYYDLDDRLHAIIDKKNYEKIDIYYHINYFGYIPLLNKDKFQEKFLIEDESQTIRLDSNVQINNEKHYIYASIRKSICIQNTTIVYSADISNKFKYSFDIIFYIKKLLKIFIPQKLLKKIKKNYVGLSNDLIGKKINYFSLKSFKNLNKVDLYEKRKIQFKLINEKLKKLNINIIFNDLNENFIPSAIPIIIDKKNIYLLNFISKFNFIHSRWAEDFPNNKEYPSNHMYKQIYLIYLFRC